MKNYVSPITIEGARILFRNFSGKEGQFNAAGDRNFCCIIEPELVDQLREDGWNIKTLEPKDPADGLAYYIPITVSYKHVPPKIYLISGNGRVLLDEETVGTLDWADISNVDLIISPYLWEMNGKSGVKAYIQTMYVTIAEDPFAAKYKDIE